MRKNIMWATLLKLRFIKECCNGRRKKKSSNAKVAPHIGKAEQCSCVFNIYFISLRECGFSGVADGSMKTGPKENWS